MPRVSRSAIDSRLGRMAREIEAIDATRPQTLEEYLDGDNETLRTALEHRIFIATQAMVDIAAHIVASQGFDAPGTYRDAVQKLGTMGVISQDIVEPMANAAGLRNAIAHMYLNLDQTLVFSGLQRTDDLKRFAAAVWEWAEGQ